MAVHVLCMFQGACLPSEEKRGSPSESFEQTTFRKALLSRLPTAKAIGLLPPFLMRASLLFLLFRATIAFRCTVFTRCVVLIPHALQDFHAKAGMVRIVTGEVTVGAASVDMVPADSVLDQVKVTHCLGLSTRNQLTAFDICPVERKGSLDKALETNSTKRPNPYMVSL